MKFNIAQDFVIQKQELEKGKEINRGSFGIVYEGKWQGGIKVAIKELFVSRSTNNEFLKELQMLKSFRHPNIVLLYGYCPSPLSLVMELLQQSLYNFLHSSEEIPWQLRYKISLNIVFGLQYIHDLNIIHRDLKSNNILLDSSYNAKITDFGMAKVKTDSKLQSSLDQGGAIFWRAPELLVIEPEFSKQSDIYALGIVLWEIATRELPFATTDSFVVINEVKKGVREKIPQDCPEQFATLINGC